MENGMNINKIIEKSKQWTLEGDCTLLQWMNQISNNLEERVTKTSSAINQMSTKLDRTSIALSNVTNNLAALQYSKFVENRVHEDDETLANTANVSSEDVTDKNNSEQDIYSFLKKNVEMMNSCHEAYSISYEDSDDDDDEPVTSVVYRSKNPYEARPLPHIYGSNLWKEKWHIGLCDSDNDFSGEENSEQFSESSSTADDSYESTAPTMSEWDSTAWGLNTQQNIERKDMHTPSNDGESSYQGEDNSQSKVSTPRTQRSITTAQQPIQDQRYYQHVPRRQESLFDDIFDDSKPPEMAAHVIPPQVVPPVVLPTPHKKIIPESYIPNEPPPDEQSIESDGNRRVGAKKTLNLFDDDEFSSFMDQIVQKATNKNIKPNEKPQENPELTKTSMGPKLFNDLNDHTPPDNDYQRPPKKPLAPNLFDDSNVHKQKQPSKTLSPNVFVDSDDLFGPQPEKKQEPPKKMLAPNLFSDSDDLFSPSISEQPIMKRKPSSPKLDDDIFKTTPQSVAIIGKTKIKNLFDDDDDDDDFDNIFSPKPSTSKTFSQATKNLFSDDLAVEPEAKDPALKNEPIKEVPPTTTGLLNDDKNTLVVESEIVSKTPLLKEGTNIQTNMFEDNDDKCPILEKEISSGTPVLKEDTFKVGSLLKKGLFDDFDDLEDENDIFATKSETKDPFENLFKKDNKLTSIPNKNLFGDEDEKVDTMRIESKKSQVVEEIDKSIPSDLRNIPNVVSDDLINEPSDDIIAPSSSMKKTQVDDLFADDAADDFESFISTNPSSKLIATATLPVTAPEPPEPTLMSVTTPKLPVVAQKPFVDKTSKPQSKVIPKKNANADLSEKTNDDNGLTLTATVKQTEQIQSPLSEEPRPNSEPLDAPRLSATSKTEIASISKLDSPLVLKSPKDDVTQKEQIKHEQSAIEEDNTQTEMVLKPDEEASRPIPKPKPKVIIEHGKIPSPSKEITDEKSLGPESTKKPSAIPSYTSLFHDDIPPEDENPNSASNEESPLHTVEEDVEVKPIPPASSVPYSSINLFADVPPDDYFSPSTPPSAAVQTKRIHSIFYDDFNETIEAGREMRTPPSYIINNEPPPDDKDNKPVISEVKKEKQQVSKLKKMDLKINVGALLPSAKLPSFKKPQAVEKSQSEILVKEQNIPSVKSLIQNDDNVPSQLQSVKTRELPENILPNLNKNRAKVQVKRRPSTRTGRQDRYRKSMIEDAVTIPNEEENEIEIQKSMSSSLFQDFETVSQERYTDIIVPKQDMGKEQIKTPVSSSLFEDLEKIDKKQEINKEPSEAFNKMPDQATLFAESDNFFNKNVSSSSSSKVTTTKIPSLFENSDSEPENIFETIKTIESNAKKSEFEPSPKTTSKNLDSLFDSDGIDENPFGTPKNFLPQSISPQETNKPTEQKSKEDLLFEPSSVQQKESKSQPVKITFKQSDESAKTTPKSLFGDSDDGSDDLFKEANVSKKAVPHKKPEYQPIAKPISKQVKPSASLFSSDEDTGSGDDIFGKARTKTATKKSEPVKDKASSSLFADLSDDDSDDLFGTSTKKTTAANKSKTIPPKNRVQSTKQPTQPQQTKTISSNPLSDLLGP